MVLLSGKRKESSIIKDIIDPFLKNQTVRKNWKDPHYKKMMELLETMPIQKPKGDLEYKIKTTLRILPEYEIYHQLYGIPKNYDSTILEKIKEYHSKHYTITKIKYNLDICQHLATQHLT